MNRLQPEDRIYVAIPADLIEAVEQVAEQHHYAYGDAIAHLVRQALHPTPDIPAPVIQELTDLRDRLTRLERDQTLALQVAVLSDRLARLETSLHSLRPPNPSSMPAAAPIVTDENEDWGQYDDEPDEVLYDFLPANS